MELDVSRLRIHADRSVDNFREFDPERLRLDSRHDRFKLRRLQTKSAFAHTVVCMLAVSVRKV